MDIDQSRRRILLWILFLFAGSGCAALIYEIVWLQLLELVIGASGVSLAVLLGSFMGGMCIGSLVLPRRISVHPHPLRVYAFLELGIGVIGILALFVVPRVADIYVHLPWHGIFTRAILASICLMPPAILMGATLPLASRFLRATPEGISWMGFFYGANIAGSVLGCLTAGFFLLRLFDTAIATYVAAAINLTVFLIALRLSRQSPYEAARVDPGDGAITPAAGRGLVYLAIALSGFSALGAEVVWTRLLSLLMGGTVYSFSIILAVFLTGLGIGSGAGSFLARTNSDPRKALALCQFLLALFIAWAAFLIAQSLPYWPINPSIYTNDWGPWHVFQLDLLRAAWMVLPSALLWGASFPLAVAAVAASSHDSGRTVGAIYASNTIGSILGSLGFSLCVIPQFGTQWAQRILILVAIAAALLSLAAVVLRRRSSPAPRAWHFQHCFSRLAWTILGALLAFFLIKAVVPIPWMLVAWGRFTAAYMAQSEPNIIDERKPLPNGGSSSQWYCTYMGEGMNVSVAVTRTAAGARYFHGAGKVQASSLPKDMRLQRMLGHLSVLSCAEPDKASDILVVACGAGVTAGSFVPYPNIKRIVICDIEPLVPKIVAPMFGKENYHVVDGIDKTNPHIVNGKEVSAIYDDGRHYIHTLPDDVRFDVITSDPIDPWVKGSAALNTVEYYEMCKRHLKPGGVMSLWMPLYESDPAAAKSLIATFFQVFPNGLIFSNDENLEGYDAVLLGQAEPSPINVDRLQALLDRTEYAGVQDSLREVGFGQSYVHPEFSGQEIAVHLLSTFAGQEPDLRGWIRNAQINRDTNLRLQYLAGMHFNSYIGTRILQGMLEYYRFPANVFAGSAQRLNTLRDALLMQGRK